MKLSFYRYLWLVCLTLIWSDGAAAGGAAEREFLVGGDISALAVIEEHGGIFRDPNQPGDAIAIMRRYGANCFRLRLFVQPTGKNVVVNDLAYTIALARRIRAAGGQWLLDFHYSDTWADPAHQTKPAAWEDLPFEQPEARVYEYTRDCLGAFQKAGVPPDLVQPGNEITPGMLWPDGKLHDVVEPERQWERFTRLLRAAVRGIQAAPADRPPRIVIHIDQGANWPKTRWFFERIEKYQVPCDVIGLSYYPWWHGSMSDLRANLHNCAATFRKDIFVVETAYPYRQMRFPQEKAKTSLAWPLTEAGQQAFLAELIAAVRQTPDRRGIGVLWWYPESIPVKDLHVWNAGKTALFDSQGRPLDALRNAFR